MSAAVQFEHSHVFLGHGHERNERRAWLVIALCGASAITDAASAAIAREPLARVEYVSLVDRESLAPLATVDERALLALAVWIGGTRLIDNRQLTVPAVHRERRSA